MKAKLKTAKPKRATSSKEKVQVGGSNVFRDLGFHDAEERLLKAKLASKITELIHKKGLTQAQIAERTALDQPKVSKLLRGQLAGFSADRLFAIVNRLGHSVEVRISARERSPEKSHTRVMIG